MQKIREIFSRFVKWSLRAGFVIAVAVIVMLTLAVLRYGNDLPDYKKLATYAPPVATRLYASDGSLLVEYAEERRVFIDFLDMPPQLINAFIAAEDQNFWRHPGVDILGIVRAAGNNVLHMVGIGGRFTGASTITQQVAKNFFLSSDRTISRKIREAILALKLERTYSKQHIMTLYLNQIFLGARAYGVGSASLMYFNKPVAELTLSEMAFLAALPKAPNRTADAVARREYVLNRMVAEGFISQTEADIAIADTPAISNDFMKQQADDFQYFAEEVRRDLLEKLGREKLYNDGLYIKTTINPKYQRAASAALRKALDNYNRGRGETAEKLQGAIVVANPHTGRILAMSGGYSFAESSFNRATQAQRQVGSTIKPFIYLSALERGDTWTPESLLLDAPIVGWREGDILWKPENYDKQFLGPVTLRQSLEQSRNVPTVRLVESIGVRTAISAAKKFGVYDDKLRNINLSLALGSGETTLSKLTLGYAAFINGGYKNNPIYVDYVQDRYGNMIQGRAGKNDVDWDADLTPPETARRDEPLSDPQSLYQVTSILQGVVERGTGRSAYLPGHTIAGKTGTTNDVKDIWFVGFSKDLVVGVYMGYDIPRALGGRTGSYVAATVFADFMKVALDGEKNQPFAIPDGIEFVRVNRKTGVSAALDPNGLIITEAFKQGQRPNAPAKSASGAGNNTNTVVGGMF